MSTWLEDVLEATKELESPRKFFLWAGMTTISAVVKRNVWVEREGGKLLRMYPNVYVFTVAPSGFKKSVPINLAKALLEEVSGTKVISGRSSIENIIQDLGNARTAPGRKGPVADSTACIMSGEFSTSLVRNPDALTILTDLYDSPDEWKNSMKHTGVDRLSNVSLSILGAMNETHFNDVISEKEITGGFIGRCQIVYSRERERRNSLIRRKSGSKPIPVAELSKYLIRLKAMQGPFEFTDEASDWYNDWYNTYEPEKSSDRTGSAIRIPDYVLKIGQILALSREPKLLLTIDDLQSALKICIESTARIETITKGVGQSEMATKQRAFLEALLKAPNHMISRERLLRDYHGDFDVHDLNRMEETFVGGGIIKEVYLGKIDGKKDAIYELTERTIKDYL